MEAKIVSLTKDGTVTMQEGFPDWEPSAYALAAKLNVSNERFGLLGFVMPPALFDEISPGVPCIPLVKMDPPQGIAPTAANFTRVKTHNDAVEVQENALATYKDAVVISIGEALAAEFREPRPWFMSRRTVGYLVQNTIRLAGTMTPDQLTQLKDSLDVIFNEGDDFAEWVAKHRKVHSAFVGSGQLIPENDKISMLKKSIQPCGFFVSAIDKYNLDIVTSTVVGQTFDNFVALMRLADNCRDKTATAAAHGYGMKADASASYDNSRGRSDARRADRTTRFVSKSKRRDRANSHRAASSRFAKLEIKAPANPDSAASGNFIALKDAKHLLNVKPTRNGIWVSFPNGTQQ